MAPSRSQLEPSERLTSAPTAKNKAPKASAKKSSTLTLTQLGISTKPSSKPLGTSDFRRSLSVGQASEVSHAEDIGTKGKSRDEGRFEDKLWVDDYPPKDELELAVHKKKVEDVRRWLIDALDGGSNGKMRKYRRVLALTGPAGVGKTMTLRILSEELHFDIMEWRNGRDDMYEEGGFRDYESLAVKFQAFLERASTYRSLDFNIRPPEPKILETPRSYAPSQIKRQIILIEDLPHLSHTATREAFHDAITAFAKSDDILTCPIVFIISNAGIRGDAKDERPGVSNRFDQDDGLDVRSVIPPDIFRSNLFIEIQFNPIAITLLKKGLNTLLDKAFSDKSLPHVKPTKEIVQIIVDSANGDIRSAAMALQFACIIDLPKGSSKGKGKSASRGRSAKGILESITRREQSLALFHVLGKLLYNKRYGDSEEAEDAPSKPPTLPKHLRDEHSRRLSKVDVNGLYADSPIDTSLLSLYVHQNYTQFCDSVTECEALISNLSAMDTIGEGDSCFNNATLIPYGFQMLALGTLHSLPTPVPRRGQKTFKPSFFEYLNKTKDAESALSDVRTWMDVKNGAQGVIGSWSKRTVVCETGAMLKSVSQSSIGQASPFPPQYRLFAVLPFNSPTRTGQIMGEGDDAGEYEVQDDPEVVEDHAQVTEAALEATEKTRKGWLSDDEIEDL